MSHLKAVFIIIIIDEYNFAYFQELNRKWSDVRQLVPQRDATLAAELRKQQNNESLRRQFAEKANAVGPWIERQMDAVTAIGMGLQVRINYERKKEKTVHSRL